MPSVHLEQQAVRVLKNRKARQRFALVRRFGGGLGLECQIPKLVIVFGGRRCLAALFLLLLLLAAGRRLDRFRRGWACLRDLFLLLILRLGLLYLELVIV